MKPFDTQRILSNHPLAHEAIEKTVTTLGSLNKGREAARNAQDDETAKFTQTLYKPFLQQISEHPEANLALEQLERHHLLETTDFLSDLPTRENRSDTLLLNLHLQEHLSVIGAPYDFEWSWGNANPPLHDRSTGVIGVRGGSGRIRGGISGRIDTASGIGVLITTDRPATVSVRPYITYYWSFSVGAVGLFSSGQARGGIDAAAFLNGAIIDGVRRSELFSARSSSGTDSRSDGGVVWVPDVTLGFNIQPGQLVAVSFGAWLECDHNNGIGSAGGGGLVQAKVSWIVVEQFSL
jgi:hypothetical protein